MHPRGPAPRALEVPRTLARAALATSTSTRGRVVRSLSLSLSRSHARDSRVSFRFMSFHSSPAAAVGRRMDALGPLSRAVMTKTKTPTTRSSASLRSSGSSSRVAMRERSRTSRRRRTTTTTRVGGGEGDFQFDPSALPTFGGKASGGASEGGGTARRGGGGLIVPGMDGFDDVAVQRNPSQGAPTGGGGGGGGGGQRIGPAGVIPKVGGALQGAFEPYKPPETFESAKVSDDENDPEFMLQLIRQRAGLWHKLATFIRPLQSRGYQPNDIFEACGVEPKEQALWVTWLQCYASLKDGAEFDNEKLSYFDDEFRGAPNLSQIMYLPAKVRAQAAMFIVENEFEDAQSRELVKAYEIKRSNVNTIAARDFNDTPGDVLAYKLYRDILELQRYQGEEEATKIYDRGIKYAASDTARERLGSAVKMFTMAMETGTSTVAAADAAGNENVAAEVQVVRLEEHEYQFKPIPVLGNLNSVTSAKVRSAATLQKDGNIFGVFSPQGNNDWVALPSWELLEFSTSPFALFCDDTSKLDVKGVKDKSEPGLLIADKAVTTPAFGKYYLVAKTSSLVLAGSNAAAESVSIMDGKDILKLEREGKSVNTLAHVLLCVRAPSRGGDDGMTTDAPM